MAQPKKLRDAVFVSQFRQDLVYWVNTDRKIAIRVMELVESVLDDPFKGIGKPEPLKYIGADTWSRRLNQEHRIVYRIKDDRIEFLQARYHY
ncbi:MAG: Txe/YoeB family addiction module toxin [Pseudanabaena frigida]|uniref:Endoribonuclease YoeB n=1 Tax=Pseudanabaena frigida TaxID=945775 RepID=A0A2W4Y360_9CYAN|nr:MAG: Txe/YoeB family addiction module toxin [Pseudanabaena frigida]